MMKPIPVKQAGFTLLEALIALLVLAVGILGLAGLQAQGIRFNHDAHVRSEASLLVYDVIERMRIQHINLAANNNVPPLPQATVDANVVAALTAYTGGDPGGACDPTSAVAAVELACWHDELQAQLPGAIATIQRTAGGGSATPDDDQFTLNLTWTDRTTGNAVTRGWIVEL